MKYSILIIFLFIGWQFAFSNMPEHIKVDYPRTLSEQVVEPSPDAAAMLRYQDCPVSYATGTADITIPLLQLNGGDTDLTLSISYHTGGIKVNDPAGSIGLGWSLRGLGRISRQICVLPDEMLEFMTAEQLKSPTAKDLYNLMFYNRKDNPNSREANYDRYNYDIPGYAGSFIIDGDSIVNLSPNGVKILRSNSTKNPMSPGSFTIITPDGTRCVFGAVETCTHKTNVTKWMFDEYSRDYENVPVTWLMTSYYRPYCNGGFTISYATDNFRAKEQKTSTPTVWRRWSTNGSDLNGASEDISTSTTTTYHNRGIPSEIKFISGSVKFYTECINGSTEDDKRVIRTIKVFNSNGDEVRNISFDNNSLFEDGRPRLDEVVISSEGKTLDKREFEYNKGLKDSYYDFFGYSNGLTHTGETYIKINVIDPETLNLNKNRAYRGNSVQSWSLKKITDATGVETTFSYDLSGCPAGANRIFGEMIYSGLCLSSIRSYDPITGRERVRKFVYSEPTMSVPLAGLDLRDFISLSGVKEYNDIKHEDNASYTLSATFTANSLNAGVPAENMRIYYGKVTETISGTNMQPIKTEYYFDNSHCIHSEGNSSWSPNTADFNVTQSTDITYSGDRSRIKLGYYIPYGSIREKYSAQDFNKVFGIRYGVTYFDERVNGEPLLTKKIVYENSDNRYRELEITENFYTSHDKVKFPAGLFVQSNVYKTFFKEEYQDNIFDNECPYDTLSSTLHCRTWVLSERVRLDSISVIHKYPNGGERTIWQRHYYNRLLSVRDTKYHENPDIWVPSPVDSLFFPETSLLPVSTITGCGNDYVIHNAIRACNIKGDKSVSERLRCVELVERNFGNMSVTDRWIAKCGTGIDSLILERQYGYYYRAPYIFPKRQILRREPSAVIAEQKFHDYNGFCRVLSMTDTDGSNYNYTWDEINNVLLSKSTGNLTSTFSHIPMVGCSSITLPSGKKHTFTYHAGRLDSEKNADGKTIASYTYSLYADCGNNLTESCVYNDLGTVKNKTYYDGFGMPVQSIALGAGSNTSQDICTYVEYDGINRPVRQWQPIPASDIDAISSVADLRSLATSVYSNDTRPYTETNYAASSGERICAVYSPGEALAAHPATSEYLCNSSTVAELKVRKFSYTPATAKIGVAGYYPDGQFDAVKSTDADGHTVITFTDWRGYKVHERRVLADGDFIDTHYINDAWGNPLIVLQPEICAFYAVTSGSFSLDSDRAKKYTFQYAYDRCGRLVSKKIPGREPETYRYDPYGRLAFMQDGNMRSRGKAVFNLYDDVSRIVLTGTCGDYAMSESVTIPVMTASRSTSGLCGSGYQAANSALFPDAKLLTATYYDNYDFLTLPTFSAIPSVTQSKAYSLGLVTGSLVAVLDSSDDSAATIATVTYYDKEERPVKTVSTTHLADTYESTETQYTLDSQPKTVKHTLKKGAKTYTDEYTYVYDNIGRLKSSVLSFSGGTPKTISMISNEYNSIGQLKRAVTDGVTTDYTYNIRGAVKTITNNLQFRQTLYYEDGDNPLYSGRISAISDNIGIRTFSYDRAGRLLSSVNVKTNFISAPYDNEVFSTYYSYDRNSNITTLDRRGYVNDSKKAEADYVDNLIFTYNGNQLISVTDNAPDAPDSSSFDFQDGTDYTPEYRYDKNGNQISDSNRGVAEVRYNNINLPSLLAFNNVRWLEYSYRADGTKLSSKLLMGNLPDGEITIKSLRPGEPVLAAGDDAVVTPDATGLAIRKVLESKYYVGNYEFSGDSLTRLNTPYGYFLNGRFYSNVYDYQGNLVRSGGETSAGVAQENGYYPYGLPVRGGGNDSFSPYLFGGKEFETRQGLNLYDFLARTYCPDEARFWQPDPMAGDYHWLSPYVYCAGDPINFIDPDGMKVFYVDMTGRIISSEEAMKINPSLSDKEKQLEGFDQVVILNGDGSIKSESKKFNEGTIRIISDNKKLNELDITAFEANNNANGKSIFESLSKAITVNNGIEFGFISQKKKQTEYSYIFTNHAAAQIASMFPMFHYALNKNKSSIIEMIHSHKRESSPSKPDTDSKQQINDYIDKTNKKNNSKLKYPNCQIFVSDSRTYFKF